MTGAACLIPCQALSWLWRYINSDRSSCFPLTCWACRIPCFILQIREQSTKKLSLCLWRQQSSQNQELQLPGPLSQTGLGCQVPSALGSLATPIDPECPLAPLALLLRCQNGSGTVLMVPQCHLHLHSHLLRFWAMRPEKTPSYLTAVALESSAPNPKKEYTCS